MSDMRMISSSLVKTSSIVGTRVTNPRGDSLGDIQEIVIDPHTGAVAYVVVSFGSFLGLGGKLFAIPFSLFRYDASGNEYLLDCAPDRLKNAPGFDRDNWPPLSDPRWSREVYEHFHPSPERK